MSENQIDIAGIIDRIPHRYPFLLIDRVLAYEPDKQVTAIKNVTINEQFFQGHFPTRAVMPGVLIVESMAQSSAILASVSLGQLAEGSLYFFTGIDKVRFRQPVVPGDQLRLEVSISRRIKTMWRFHGEAFVGDKRVAQAELMCAVSQ